jgi:hypothetical protein
MTRPIAPGSESPTSTPFFVPEEHAADRLLWSLVASLAGFVVIAWVLYQFKFDHVTDLLYGVPTRLVFAFGILLAVAPFLVTIAHRVPIQFLAPPILLLFFLYLIFSPFGIPYDRDPVYVYQFAQSLLSSGSWTPGAGVTTQGVTYSYYPGGTVFIAESASLTATPLFTTFDWSTELLRLLLIPPLIYAFTARLLHPRAAALAVLLYVVEPSIEMNIPTQQDFAVTFFIFSVVLLGYLAVDTGRDAQFLRLSLIMTTGLVIASHHVSTYILIGFLGAIALLPRVLWRRDPFPNAHSMSVFLRTLVMGVAWGLLIALPVILQQATTLDQNISALFHPGVATSAIPGASFPLYEIVAVVLGVVAAGVLAVLAWRDARRRGDRSFMTVAVMSVLLLAILSVPFLSTGFSFLALREFEYIGVILAPVSAWWIVTRLAPGTPATAGLTAPSAPRTNGWARPGSFRRARRAVGHPVLAVGLIALFVVSGVFVPLSTRDQFAPVVDLQADSPMYISPTAYAAAEWATAHLSRSHEIWGDYLAYTVLGGFGDFRIIWNSYMLFNGTGFSALALSRLDVGSYIVIDPYMNTSFTYPMFWGPNADQPSAALTAGELAKFQNPLYFSLVYVNPVFTIYVANALPPVS